MRVALVILAAVTLGIPAVQASVGDMTNHGGPELRSPAVYVVLWLPPGRHIDAGSDSVIRSRLQDMIEHLSGTHYLGVLTQYGATNTIQFGGLWVDTTAYPHAGTAGDPLQVSDYANSVKRAMTSNGWTAGLDKLYLVYTANETEACGLRDIPSGARDPAGLFTPQDCTFPSQTGDQCAVHSYFTQAGQPVAYAAIPYSSAAACIPAAGGSADPNRDIPLDYVLSNAALFIAAMVVDPEGNAWYTTNPEAGEIACIPNVEDAADLRLGGTPVPVFTLWSNKTHACAIGYPPLRVGVMVKAKTVRPRGSQTVTVTTEAGADVSVEIDYPNGRIKTTEGTARNGTYGYRWRVPKTKGRVTLVASVSTPDGGEGSASRSFRIR